MLADLLRPSNSLQMKTSMSSSELSTQCQCIKSFKTPKQVLPLLLCKRQNGIFFFMIEGIFSISGMLGPFFALAKREVSLLRAIREVSLLRAFVSDEEPSRQRQKCPIFKVQSQWLLICALPPQKAQQLSQRLGYLQ
jgi:hypothetical protein